MIQQIVHPYLASSLPREKLPASVRFPTSAIEATGISRTTDLQETEIDENKYQLTTTSRQILLGDLAVVSDIWRQIPLLIRLHLHASETSSQFSEARSEPCAGHERVLI